jgi:hypothetical protein
MMNKIKGGSSVARVYADANEKLGPDHWDYESFSLQWGWVKKKSDFMSPFLPEPCVRTQYLSQHMLTGPGSK